MAMKRPGVAPRSAVAVVAVVLVALACGNGGGEGTERPTTSSEPTTTAEPTTPGAGDDVALVPCENPDGFVLGRPEGWVANDSCSKLHPEPFTVPEATDERVAAITAYIDPVPFSQVAAPDPDRAAERATTTIEGLQAVRLEYETAGDALWPGTPITAYLVDLAPHGNGPATLFLDTVGLSSFDFEQNQVVLDRVARSLSVTREDVPTDSRVVARYGGGGGGFRVEGEVRASAACLRIPPDGEQVCTDVPERDELLTVQLVDLAPVLAGVTGEAVFAVNAERDDARAVTVLPAPIDDTGIMGFAFTFGLDEVIRLRLFDITGTEIGTIEPAEA